MMETAIFAYLGLFLFSHRYHWNIFHAIIAVIGCLLSRGVMITCLSTVSNFITNIQMNRATRRPQLNDKPDKPSRRQPHGNLIIDKRMQLALWVAGLRGAMSFALVEYIPLYDAVTGEGSRFKAELKAMTSVSILFTVFVLGGLTHYTMDLIGLAPAGADPEMKSLLEQDKSERLEEDGFLRKENNSILIRNGNSNTVRQRQGNHETDVTTR